jgi:hypothetical protein
MSILAILLVWIGSILVYIAIGFFGTALILPHVPHDKSEELFEFGMSTIFWPFAAVGLLFVMLVAYTGPKIHSLANRLMNWSGSQIGKPK